jgi:hypothetical protein
VKVNSSGRRIEEEELVGQLCVVELSNMNRRRFEWDVL